ncbi:MAG: hypothetical protein LKF66_00715 [Clostridium tyrobutyricum]|jgi:hypothetical protein|uniref:hypothetical protein n=2 Tax=Clostridium tyrobutyricum TaxID=1519 RepID=UPI0011CB63B3|nr:hypothetical protein [Clostridium tyrobutyricum]MCH4236465.1 hypothetical protein [Clostridium tyrobutyricum]
MEKLKMQKGLIKSVRGKIFTKKKKGDITYVLGIVVVAVIMIAIILAAKGLTWSDLATLIDNFVTTTLFDHIVNPFK